MPKKENLAQMAQKWAESSGDPNAQNWANWVTKKHGLEEESREPKTPKKQRTRRYSSVLGNYNAHLTHKDD